MARWQTESKVCHPSIQSGSDTPEDAENSSSSAIIMKTEVVKKLIEKGAIKRETEVEAHYKGKDLSGAALARARGVFLILGARLMEDQVTFDAVDTRWGGHQSLKADDIIRIDGMEPDRFANIFGLTEDGEPLKQGKRRGRKPKALLAQMAAEAAEKAAQQQIESAGWNEEDDDIEDAA
jgi:hypothetical protein